MHKLKTALRIVFLSLRELKKDYNKSKEYGATQRYLKGLMKSLFLSFCKSLCQTSKNELSLCAGIDAPQYLRLKKLTNGLLHPFNQNPKISVSVLTPVFHPKLNHFRQAIESVLDQGLDDLEVLVGFDGEHPKKYYELLEDIRRTHSAGHKLKEYTFDRAFGGGISRTTNSLAEKSKKEFLLLMDHDDWLRPDLLYRYSQAQDYQSNDRSNTVFYCDEFKIDENNSIIPKSLLKKPATPNFPYIFVNWICHALFVPRVLWQKVGGLHPDKDGAQDFDLCLRLDVAGAKFLGVQAPMYAWRAHQNSTAMNANSKPQATNAGVKSMEEYFKAKNLDWTCKAGPSPTVYWPTPKRRDSPKVQAIVPFKDEKDMTIAAVESLLKQDHTDIEVHCIDNNSSDSSILDSLKILSPKVVAHRFSEPFNYSRINNFGVSKGSPSSPYILFMNNDVVLEESAVQEMLRWIDQPNIGIVGCRLLYPNQTIQHGGVRFSPEDPSSLMNWHHIDCGLRVNEALFSKTPLVVDGVTAACSLMRRIDFEKIGGFDEMHFPVAFSDTDLCLRLQNAGYLCFFTPAAQGVHHESISRDKGNLEDVESSQSFTRELGRTFTPQSKVPYYI